MSKKILILGGFGFIGTNLIIELLKNEKFEIVVFEAKNSIFGDQQLLKKIEVHKGDFNNVEDYKVIFKNNKIDLVVHLISTTIPSTSNNNIKFDIESNLINTINLLDVMIKYNCKNIVFFSSGGTVYGPSKKKPKKKEEDSKNPICSYGIIKLTIEEYIKLYDYLYDLNYLIIRPSNPYGEHHYKLNQGLINVILSKIINNETVEIWGDGSIVRDYIYIKNLAKIVRELIEKDIKKEIFNVGTGKGYSVNWIINFIQNEIGDFKLTYSKERKVDIKNLELNIDKLKSFINLDLTSIKTGIKKTYTWLKKIHQETSAC